MYCRKCGKEIKEGKFCPYCGARINEDKPIKRRKVWIVLCICLVVVLVVCGFAKFFAKKETVKEEKADEMSVVGMYEGESRGWLLWMYEDGSLYMDDSEGTYEQIEENNWIMSINDFAFKLKGSLTEDGNLYVTSDHPNWDSEIFYRQEEEKLIEEKIDLKDVIGKNWEELSEIIPSENYENMHFRDRDGWKEFIDDKGTRFRSGEEEKEIYDARISAYETNYCIDGIYIGQDYEEAKNILDQKKLKMTDEEQWDESWKDFWEYHFIGEGTFDSYSFWEDSDIFIGIYERSNKVLYVELTESM